MVTVNGALVVPITWLPKFRLIGDNVTAGDWALAAMHPKAARPQAR
jgi:hypothetical protein